jgi:hypothetical protein
VLEVVPLQILSTLEPASLSFVLHRLVLSVFGTARFATFVGACLKGLFIRFLVQSAACFFWVHTSPVAVLSARGYHKVLLVSTFYA